MTSGTDKTGAVDAYDALYYQFGWKVPTYFNIAQACCSRWALDARTASSTAIIAHHPNQAPERFSFAQLQEQANRLSNALVAIGVHRGDRVAVVLAQRFETAVALMALFQMGAVAMPLSTLFGPEALAFRLHDSEAVAAICDQSGVDKLTAATDACPLLRHVIVVDQGDRGVHLDYRRLLGQESADFKNVTTHADDPAVLIYTSGTTGNPKGALVAHRSLIGNLSGFVCSQNWFGFNPALPAGDGHTDAIFWSPADWTWTGGLMDALLPTLYFGRPIVACTERFSANLAFTIFEQYGVTHTFLFPTALKAMMKAYPNPGNHFKFELQAIMSAGEAVGDAVFAYCERRMNVTVNEMFGQTEINYIVGNCNRFWPARAGSMGRGYPGHRVAVIDDDGNECAVGVAGDVAVHRQDIHGDPDPIFFLGYWKNPGATHAKFTGDWCRTGDLATRDADGYLWYSGRADDMFKAAGYRIGPSEIENCLVRHPWVANAAVVPKPDTERGALVKAYVVLTPEAQAQRSSATGGVAAFDSQLIADLQAHVRGRLAPYEYPKEIEFIDALPMTTTGKVQRRVLRLQELARAEARLSSKP